MLLRRSKSKCVRSYLLLITISKRVDKQSDWKRPHGIVTNKLVCVISEFVFEFQLRAITYEPLIPFNY